MQKKPILDITTIGLLCLTAWCAWNNMLGMACLLAAGAIIVDIKND